MKLPRWVHRAIAFVGGYFWLPCPVCGRRFGGHENPSGLLRTVARRSGAMYCARCVARYGHTIVLTAAEGFVIRAFKLPVELVIDIDDRNRRTWRSVHVRTSELEATVYGPFRRHYLGEWIDGETPDA